ncbi:aminodeoxychorismate lyase [Desulfarculus baarsii DSM 2075]|uniref:Endolytic murein transglycosylase n=1 Tax=Desulfarculus baarsii (strain ATCC 33931 / DSM 2075 / LMG 7858 / VKM B-1802 / 2st14) TaxID=644282 RepID=E1QKM5_DESB2|nr:endolytic transglycosylase MltG [Desulfarculus baarsii]ADK86234.1 aminodeoxychorismate lyase [Desulfarculus baarsii DSM 2075]
MNRGLIAAIVVIAVCLAAVAGYFGGRTLLLNHTAGIGDKDVVVEIPPGAGVRAVADLLGRADVVSSPNLFWLTTRLTSADGPILAGEYKLSPAMTYGGILRVLRQGKVLLHTVVLPEGLTMAQAVGRLAQAGLIDEQKALALCGDKGFVTAMGLAGPNMEGYLFPDTYHLAKGLGERRILGLLARRFLTAWRVVEQRASAQKLGMAQTVTLASIIEAEAKLANERPLISAVYHNRLRAGMLLQADPTVIYGLGGLKRPLNRADLAVDTPYNTYLRPGLPPGPICNPGLASLEAAVAPATVDYLYFVAKGDGGHAFSADYRDQVKAINRYRRR